MDDLIFNLFFIVLEIVGWLLTLLPFVLIGGFVSLLVLLPPVSGLGQRTPMVRAGVIILTGMITFGLSFCMYSRFMVINYYVFRDVSFHEDPGMIPSGPVIENLRRDEEDLQRDEEHLRKDRNAIVDELWIRYVVPPPLQRDCYTTDLLVCQEANLINIIGTDEWGEYLIFVVGCLVSALTNGFLAWVFTRKKRHVGRNAESLHD